MKKQALIIALLTLFSFSCTTDETIESNDNLRLESTTSLTSNINSLLQSDEFKDFLDVGGVNSKTSLQKGEHSGLMILDDGYNLAFSAFDPSNSTLSFLGGQGTIEKLPNGKAKFSVHTTNPEAEIFSFSTFETLFSSNCIDAPRGVFNFNFISEYEVEIFEPIPGLIFTNYIPTGENSSAESASGHCKMSNAQPMFNENFEFIGCSEATEYKTIKLKGNRNANGEGGFNLSIN